MAEARPWSWTESVDEADGSECVVLRIPLPPGVVSKDVSAKLSAQKLIVKLRGQHFFEDAFAEDRWLCVESSYWEFTPAEGDDGPELRYFLIKNDAFQGEALYCLFASESSEQPRSICTWPQAKSADDRSELRRAPPAVAVRAAFAAGRPSATEEAKKADREEPRPASAEVLSAPETTTTVPQAPLLPSVSGGQNEMSSRGPRTAKSIAQLALASWSAEGGGEAVSGSSLAEAIELAWQQARSCSPGENEEAASLEACRVAGAILAFNAQMAEASHADAKGNDCVRKAVSLSARAAVAAGCSDAHTAALSALLGMLEGFFIWDGMRHLETHAAQVAGIIHATLGLEGIWYTLPAATRSQKLSGLCKVGGLSRPGECTIALCQARLGIGKPPSASRLDGACNVLKQVASKVLIEALLPLLQPDGSQEVNNFGVTFLECMDMARMSNALEDGCGLRQGGEPA